jgi:hypothetical protein
MIKKRNNLSYLIGVSNKKIKIGYDTFIISCSLSWPSNGPVVSFHNPITFKAQHISPNDVI